MNIGIWDRYQTHDHSIVIVKIEIVQVLCWTNISSLGVSHVCTSDKNVIMYTLFSGTCIYVTFIIHIYTVILKIGIYMKPRTIP
jgi:hypothetical protein